MRSPASTINCSFNLVLLTVRDNPIARDIILSALNPCPDLRGFQFTIAYGGSNTDHLDWIRQQSRRVTEQGGKLIIVHKEGSWDRLCQATSSDKEWTSFISDDDPFSTNMIRSLVRTSANVKDSTTSVVPSFHLGHAGTKVFNRKVTEIIGTQANDRLIKLTNNPSQIGVLYYGAHRTKIVTSWKSFLNGKKFIPSYADQLLSCWSAVHGDIIVSDEPAVFLRDESNWSSVDAGVRSDARHYPTPVMAAFHEVFWVADMFELMSRHIDCDKIKRSLHPWVTMMLTRCVSLFDSRVTSLGLIRSNREIEILRATIDTIKWLQSVSSTDEFLARMNEFLDLSRAAEERLEAEAS